MFLSLYWCLLFLCSLVLFAAWGSFFLASYAAHGRCVGWWWLIWLWSKVYELIWRMPRYTTRWDNQLFPPWIGLHWVVWLTAGVPQKATLLCIHQQTICHLSWLSGSRWSSAFFTCFSLLLLQPVLPCQRHDRVCVVSLPTALQISYSSTRSVKAMAKRGRLRGEKKTIGTSSQVLLISLLKAALTIRRRMLASSMTSTLAGRERGVYTVVGL